MKPEIINHNSQEIVSDLKLYQTSYSTKEVQNSVKNNFYSSNTLNRKNTCKISEKDCSDINSIVRNSVEKINDLLNSQGFNSINNSNKKTQKILNNKNKPMKTNFTFNINNFINVPNNKNDSINTVNKKDRYDDLEDDLWINNNNENNVKNKSNQKRNNNDKVKNRTF